MVNSSVSHSFQHTLRFGMNLVNASGVSGTFSAQKWVRQDISPVPLVRK